MNPLAEEFVAAFLASDVEQATRLAADPACPTSTRGEGIQIHSWLKAAIEKNDGHCHSQYHLEIANLLLSSEVKTFRQRILNDDGPAVASALDRIPELVHAEFTAGRGIAQPIHHFQSREVGTLLIAAGANLDARTSVHGAGETPLAMQVRFGSLECIELLLDQGADANAYTDMHLPSNTMRPLIQKLLKRKWDIHAGNQLLHDARHGHGKRIAIWLEFGVDPNQRNADGQTALHFLANRGKGREAILALLNAGADVDSKDNRGETPRSIAERKPELPAMQVILSAGSGSSSD